MTTTSDGGTRRGPAFPLPDAIKPRLATGDRVRISVETPFGDCVLYGRILAILGVRTGQSDCRAHPGAVQYAVLHRDGSWDVYCRPQLKLAPPPVRCWLCGGVGRHRLLCLNPGASTGRLWVALFVLALLLALLAGSA